MLSALVAAALLAGLAGAWSPCGFSMVDTLAPGGYAQRRRTSVLASALFAVGAVAGGVATFGGLSLVGGALGTGGGALAAGAAALLLAAALGDGAGRRIVPQVRRQVPEPWRRNLPVPLAAGLYGVLLGLGFTTFVLSFATYALAAVCLALGNTTAGVAIGVAFGIGRAIPVAVLAPLQEHEIPADVAASMAERPEILRALRAGAAAALALGAAMLALDGAPARAAEIVSAGATDPSAADGLLAWHGPQNGPGVLRRPDRADFLPGTDPAVGGGLVAWREGDRIHVARQDTLQVLRTVDAPAAGDLALSAAYLAWRERSPGRSARILALDLAAGGGTRLVATAPSGGELGRPALDGTMLVHHVAGRRGTARIVGVDLVTGRRRTLRSRRRALLLNPSLLGGRLLYVRSTASRQQLVVGSAADGGDSVVYSMVPTARRDAGHEPGKANHRHGYRRGRRPAAPARPPRGVTWTLWTTALAGDAAYVTRLRAQRGSAADPLLLRVPLGRR